jgi:uncharacterized protein YdeI (YjbR/CyaY-like superfamily)
LADWRAWLAANHTQRQGVWLVYLKQSSGDATFTDGDAVDEALCFGWIDSLPRKLDDRRTMLYFSPRKTGSPWSAVNKRKIEALEASGRMTSIGRAKIDAAKADGSWSLLDAIERLEEPADLTAALAKSVAAAKNWSAFPPSARKGALWIIASSKTEATRAKRIAQCVRLAIMNERLGQFRPER